MVIPIERTSNSHKIKKYVGNDLNLNIFDNKKILIVTGNNCKLKLSENSGLIKVVGDYCDITVSTGNGTIEYIGNYGKIKLGLDMSEDTVSYIGNGGEISKYTTTKNKAMGRHNDVTLETGRKANSETCIDISNAFKIRCGTPLLHRPIHMSVPNSRINKYFKTENENI